MENSITIEKQIQKKLTAVLDIVHFEIKDFTGRHLAHKQHEGGFHLEAVIVSTDFENKSLVERHRMVYSAVGKLMNHEIHALSMKTFTPDEWKN